MTTTTDGDGVVRNVYTGQPNHETRQNAAISELNQKIDNLTALGNQLRDAQNNDIGDEAETPMVHITDAEYKLLLEDKARFDWLDHQSGLGDGFVLSGQSEEARHLGGDRFAFDNGDGTWAGESSRKTIDAAKRT